MATGPQRYPGASLSSWYQDDYGGDLMEVNVVVLHTTEGTSLPDYGGGASAPNLTAVPDFSGKRLRWYQHFDIDRSSRALVNLAGGVQTNTLNVVQVELTGTCDPDTHAKWTKSGYAHIFWPEAPGWALRDLADFLAWAHAQHGVPLTGPTAWKAYPSSYGATTTRMTGAQWNAFKGICGHQHVPENTHGDPGAIDFDQLIALAKGISYTPEEDPDVAFTDAQAKQLAAIATSVDKLVSTQKVAPWQYKGTGVTLDAYGYLRGTNADLKSLASKVEGLGKVTLDDAQLAALADKVAAAPAFADAIAEKVAAKLADRLAD
ncbi:hypothetical protein [Streptomyces sp. NPDC088812]|uniref:hypothetical protein n=1 Tax=Streptomyces sp. NPDC088812 TaxID=3365905 RepID=UPI003810244D